MPKGFFVGASSNGVGLRRCTEEMAVAMGFGGVQDLFDSTNRLTKAIEDEVPLKAADWLRVLMCTEIVFASDAIGSGRDWSITSGFSDEESLILLRSVQSKLKGIGSLLDVAFGTRYRKPWRLPRQHLPAQRRLSLSPTANVRAKLRRW